MIRNDSLFFTVEADLTKVYELRPKQHHALILRPNMTALNNNRKLFLRVRNEISRSILTLTVSPSPQELYIEEHIVIYNVNEGCLSEKQLVFLRLQFGKLPLKEFKFHTSPGLKNAYPYVALEERILRFLRDFNVFWSDFLSDYYAQHPDGVSGGPAVTKKKLRSSLDVEKTDEKPKGEALIKKRGSDLPQRASHRTRSLLSAVLQMKKFPESAETRMHSLYFEFRYITDELIFFGLKKFTGRFAVRLAQLLYWLVLFFYLLIGIIHELIRHFTQICSPLFKQFNLKSLFSGSSKILQADLEKPEVEVLYRLAERWIYMLRDFLSYFPDQNTELVC